MLRSEKTVPKISFASSAAVLAVAVVPLAALRWLGGSQDLE
jgi:hypothetical protein